MLPQFVSAKRGKNSSQLTVISYNMRYGTAEDGVNAWEFRKPATIKMTLVSTKNFLVTSRLKIK